MSPEILVAGAALVIALVSLGLQLLHMKRDPDVPEIR